MLNIYCWSCGTQIDKDDVLGLGHFDENIGKYQGKAFVTFRCPKCQKVRYQILNENTLSLQKKIAKNKDFNGSCQVKQSGQEINIDHVIDFFESLNDIDTVDCFLHKCRMETDPKNASMNKPIIQPLDVYNLFNNLNDISLKRLMILTIDENNYPVTWEFLGEGLNKPINFEPKVIFHTPFLLKEKVSVIIAENLKDYYVEPEKKDILITKRLVKTGKILGIDFLDRIVINDDNFHSYDELDLI